jgi:hypothetical protein
LVRFLKAFSCARRCPQLPLGALLPRFVMFAEIGDVLRNVITQC